MNYAFPYSIDASGRTSDAELEAHVRQLIEQVLFTAPGERVNRPDFGAGLLDQVFQPNGNELAATLEALVSGSLQKYLADLVLVEGVEVTIEESEVRVGVKYMIRRNRERRIAQFSSEV